MELNLRSYGFTSSSYAVYIVCPIFFDVFILYVAINELKILNIDFYFRHVFLQFVLLLGLVFSEVDVGCSCTCFTSCFIPVMERSFYSLNTDLILRHKRYIIYQLSSIFKVYIITRLLQY